MSRSFVAALAGIGVTILSWYGPWLWPAWPAFTVLDLAFGHSGYSDLPYATRAAVLIALIVLNVLFWAVGAYGLIRAGSLASRMIQNRKTAS